MEENNNLIISSVQSLIRNEIDNALFKIEENLKQGLEKISLDQIQLKRDLTSLNTKIKTLDLTCRTLQTENEKLQRDINYLQNNSQKSTNQQTENHDKMFVLHGLIENYWETDEDIIGRVVNMFFDLLKINLTDYIEGVKFIGKRGQKRPLKVELISKRMTKYIIDNSYYLKEAGFSASEYLCPTALQERRKLNHALQAARQSGHHAVIRNNKLFINGREMNTYPQQIHENSTTILESKETNSEQLLPTPLQSPLIPCLPISQSTNTTNTMPNTSINISRTNTNKTLTNSNTTNINEQNNKTYKSKKPKTSNFRN